jgi:outer membrane immunogenic protein
MHIMRTLVPTALVAMTLFPPNSAADPRDRYFPCCDNAQEYNWSGFFLGAHAGGAISQVDWNFTTLAEGGQHNDRSFGGGVQAGFQRQWGRLVAGVEVSYTRVDFDSAKPSAALPGTTFSSNVSDLLIVSGKLGYGYERWLAFAKAGYATAEFDLRSTGVVTGSSSSRDHGWMMGVGIDYALTESIVLGVEYDWSFFSLDSRTVAAIQADGRDDIQMIAARLMFKFGTGPLR